MGPHHAVELAAMTRTRAVVTLGERADVDLEVVDRLARASSRTSPQFVMVPDRAAGAVPLGRSVHRARTFTGLLHEVLAVGDVRAWTGEIAADAGETFHPGGAQADEAPPGAGAVRLCG